jgi:hypothetical protein
MAVARRPPGADPPPEDFGARFSQKREWLMWPPAWKFSSGSREERVAREGVEVYWLVKLLGELT